MSSDATIFLESPSNLVEDTFIPKRLKKVFPKKGLDCMRDSNSNFGRLFYEPMNNSGDIR